MSTKSYPVDTVATPSGNRQSQTLDRQSATPGLERLPRLRAIARARRKLAPALLAVPALLVVALDAHTRGERLASMSPRYIASYAAAMLESGVLWGLLLYVASARRGASRWLAAGVLIVLGTLALGGQVYFHRAYSTYLNLDATLFGTSVGASVFG